MATSPNYAWAEPDNSSLVKNGAQDIRALGDAIDTSVWNVGYGQAGKNKIINGDFNINQRSFTTATADGTYGFDRWMLATSSGSTYTAQTFTAGTAPVAGYEGTNFAQLATVGQSSASDLTIFIQKIENVRTFANQTVTISFWAKATSGTPKVAAEIKQGFGSGGSADVNTYAGQVTLTTSWARYSVSVAVPSISGKTIGASSSLQLFLWTSAGTSFNSRTGSLGVQNATISFWGVQAEYGSYATPFQTATGTIQGELAACQRYYERVGGTDVYATFGNGIGQSGTTLRIITPYKVTKRVTPTAIDFSTLQVNDGTTIIAVTSMTLAASSINKDFGALDVVVASGGTQYRPYVLGSNNSASAFLGFSAEL
jgi:hypothetical protein